MFVWLDGWPAILYGKNVNVGHDKQTAVLQVCGDGKALLDTLQTPVSSSSANSITAKADYSEAAGHVLDVVHEVRLQDMLDSS